MDSSKQGAGYVEVQASMGNVNMEAEETIGNGLEWMKMGSRKGISRKTNSRETQNFSKCNTHVHIYTHCNLADSKVE